ncbi:hypothetical protein ASAC_0771 [Acidilobus saccharovorans 345-15]|uniref:Uncharacterized protein n=1 Tax=Acidilobus saccharovorans (strain DSM 16705 / JCM 18335 / VKM B-2471 / 345-15) TaxID=666510 RepID=D9Q1I9_ACIS3|nr:DsrE family protein [Acidilobus saccharovorans]ADL19177.1 hypothetical protein ASAC_0771 [Acidilobus saccharovorans 345-15]
MVKIFVICTAGRDDINRVNMAINFALGARKNAGADVSFMFLGRGVEYLMKNAANADEVRKQIEQMKQAGIDVAYCSVSAKGLGLTPDMLIEGVEPVMGGVHTAKKVQEGYEVVSF